MFIFTVKSPLKSKKSLVVLMLSLLVLTALVVCVTVSGIKVKDKTSCEGFGEYSLSATDEKQRESFLSQFGLEPDEETVSTKKIIIPSVFNDVFEEYNELQKKQGLDLSKYKGKNAEEYMYRCGDDYVTVIVYDGCVIGGHKCSKDDYNRYVTFFN